MFSCWWILSIDWSCAESLFHRFWNLPLYQGSKLSLGRALRTNFHVLRVFFPDIPKESHFLHFFFFVLFFHGTSQVCISSKWFWFFLQKSWTQNCCTSTWKLNVRFNSCIRCLSWVLKKHICRQEYFFRKFSVYLGNFTLLIGAFWFG